MNHTIELEDLTKDYGQGRGVFHLTFSVREGQAVGFLGANGAGKTTTIRHLMGFLRPETGHARILGMDCFRQAASVQDSIGYLPGEIAFMEQLTGLAFIQFMAQMKQIKDLSLARRLMDYLELDTGVKLKKMSKGMKQKVGLVLAFMQDAPILILDEPTSGLDPLMQNKFVELINREKSRGKTILMSSHIFEEVEHTCDRIVMIKDGRLVADESMSKIKTSQSKHYQITFSTEEQAALFQRAYPQSTRTEATVSFLQKGSPQKLLQDLSSYPVEDINARYQTLEEVFLQYYGGKKS